VRREQEKRDGRSDAGAMDPRAGRRARRDQVAANARARTDAGRNAPRLVRWRRFRRRVGGALARALAPLLLRALAATWRVQRTGGAGRERFDGAAPWILAFWHGRMLPMLPLRAHRARGIHVLVSPSDDGGLASIALRRFGYRVVRGSLSRGGSRALREMDDVLANGGQLVLTPDGPRGPRHQMNSGVAWLARASGAPIVPVGVAVDRAWHLRSWDRFTIPKPFARVVIAYGDPVRVARTATDGELEGLTQQLRDAMLALERDAFARLGVPDDLDGAR
jgi:lysophospholipid acyltransferase (LPLAT)-like uncharacterized protein